MLRSFNRRTDFGIYECPPTIGTTEEYNSIAESIKNDDDTWFYKFNVLCNHYFQRHTTGGNLHNVLEDENIDDENLHWCSGLCCGENDQEGADLANLMLVMTLEQRQRVVEAYPYSNT
jgi:hypothetical protein